MQEQKGFCIRNENKLMEKEFDKEIDSLLRKSANGENVFTAERPLDEHIDADEISIFAENALPEKAKPRVIKHLADCDRCRTILTNVIVLNSEAEADVASAVVAETKIASTEIPWYQRLFATKNLAFGMGALALIFAAGIGFVVIQNLSSSDGLETAKVEKDANRMTEDQSVVADADGISLGEDRANSNSTATESNSGLGDAKEDMLKTPTGSPEVLSNDSKDETSPKKKPLILGKAQNEEEAFANSKTNTGLLEDLKRRDNDEISVAGDKIAESDIASAPEKKDKGKNEDRKPGRAADREANKPPAPPKVSSPITTRGSRTRTERSKKTAKEKEETRNGTRLSAVAPARRKLSGKTFTRRNNTWYDSAYKGQKTTSVRRNTKTYRKLDSGLRSITDKLSGTVVVVWKSKAYKVR